MKKKIAVIGVGSAGILTLSHFISAFDNSWEIISIHNPAIDIVGIGESTNPSFIETLEMGLDFSFLDDLEALDATPKFATRYKNWGKTHVDSPLLGGRAAIHFNNRKLKPFAFERLTSLWPEKFKVIEGNVDSLSNVLDNNLKNTKVKVVVDGTDHMFDYVIDCRGFPKDYTEYFICDKMPVNHCLVHNKKQPGDWNYTGHRATLDGWMFEIPLTTRQSYGYLFNDTITSVEQAKENFSKEINVPVNELDNIEYKFQSYYSQKPVDGRIFKNGNSFGFFEPMAATSIWMYGTLNVLYESIIETMESGGIVPEPIANEYAINKGKLAQDVICFFYHGGSQHNTEFWKMAVKNCSEHVKRPNGYVEMVINAMKKGVENGLPFSKKLDGAPFGARPHYNFDKKFGHNYFTKPDKDVNIEKNSGD